MIFMPHTNSDNYEGRNMYVPVVGTSFTSRRIEQVCFPSLRRQHSGRSVSDRVRLFVTAQARRKLNDRRVIIAGEGERRLSHCLPVPACLDERRVRHCCKETEVHVGYR